MSNPSTGVVEPPQPRVQSQLSPGCRVRCPKTDTIYELGEQLGSGAAAVVFRCRKIIVDPATGLESYEPNEYAAKIMDLRGLRLRRDVLRERTKLRREVSILRSLHHPCIVNLLHVLETDDDLLLIMELVKGGELFFKIIDNQSLSEDQARYVLIQIIQALFYMHGKGIIHRDLKPENILVSSEVFAGFFCIKVADFGLAKLIRNGISEARTFVGTPQYWAPEVIECARGMENTYGAAADLWSLGCVLYVMLGGAYPFDHRLGPIDTLIRTGQYHFRYPRFQRVSEEAKDVIRGLLTVDPRRRMTLEQLSQRPWIRDFVPPSCVPSLPILKPLPSEDFRGKVRVVGKSVLGSFLSISSSLPSATPTQDSTASAVDPNIIVTQTGDALVSTTASHTATAAFIDGTKSHESGPIVSIEIEKCPGRSGRASVSVRAGTSKKGCGNDDSIEDSKNSILEGVDTSVTRTIRSCSGAIPRQPEAAVDHAIALCATADCDTSTSPHSGANLETWSEQNEQIVASRSPTSSGPGSTRLTSVSSSDFESDQSSSSEKSQTRYETSGCAVVSSPPGPSCQSVAAMINLDASDGDRQVCQRSALSSSSSDNEKAPVVLFARVERPSRPQSGLGVTSDSSPSGRSPAAAASRHPNGPSDGGGIQAVTSPWSGQSASSSPQVPIACVAGSATYRNAASGAPDQRRRYNTSGHHESPKRSKESKAASNRTPQANSSLKDDATTAVVEPPGSRTRFRGDSQEQRCRPSPREAKLQTKRRNNDTPSAATAHDRLPSDPPFASSSRRPGSSSTPSVSPPSSPLQGVSAAPPSRRGEPKQSNNNHYNYSNGGKGSRRGPKHESGLDDSASSSGVSPHAEDEDPSAHNQFPVGIAAPDATGPPAMVPFYLAPQSIYPWLVAPPLVPSHLMAPAPASPPTLPWNSYAAELPPYCLSSAAVSPAEPFPSQRYIAVRWGIPGVAADGSLASAAVRNGLAVSPPSRQQHPFGLSIPPAPPEMPFGYYNPGPIMYPAATPALQPSTAGTLDWPARLAAAAHAGAGRLASRSSAVSSAAKVVSGPRRTAFGAVVPKGIPWALSAAPPIMAYPQEQHQPQQSPAHLASCIVPRLQVEVLPEDADAPFELNPTPAAALPASGVPPGSPVVVGNHSAGPSSSTAAVGVAIPCGPVTAAGGNVKTPRTPPRNKYQELAGVSQRPHRFAVGSAARTEQIMEPRGVDDPQLQQRGSKQVLTRSPPCDSGGVLCTIPRQASTHATLRRVPYSQAGRGLEGGDATLTDRPHHREHHRQYRPRESGRQLDGRQQDYSVARGDQEWHKLRNTKAPSPCQPHSDAGEDERLPSSSEGVLVVSEVLPQNRRNVALPHLRSTDARIAEPLGKYLYYYQKQQQQGHYGRERPRERRLVCRPQQSRELQLNDQHKQSRHTPQRVSQSSTVEAHVASEPSLRQPRGVTGVQPCPPKNSQQDSQLPTSTLHAWSDKCSHASSPEAVVSAIREADDVDSGTFEDDVVSPEYSSFSGLGDSFSTLDYDTDESFSQLLIAEMTPQFEEYLQMEILLLRIFNITCLAIRRYPEIEMCLRRSLELLRHVQALSLQLIRDLLFATMLSLVFLSDIDLAIVEIEEDLLKTFFGDLQRLTSDIENRVAAHHPEVENLYAQVGEAMRSLNKLHPDEHFSRNAVPTPPSFCIQSRFSVPLEQSVATKGKQASRSDDNCEESVDTRTKFEPAAAEVANREAEHTLGQFSFDEAATRRSCSSESSGRLCVRGEDTSNEKEPIGAPMLDGYLRQALQTSEILVWIRAETREVQQILRQILQFWSFLTSVLSRLVLLGRHVECLVVAAVSGGRDTASVLIVRARQRVSDLRTCWEALHSHMRCYVSEIQRKNAVANKVMLGIEHTADRVEAATTLLVNQRKAIVRANASGVSDVGTASSLTRRNSEESFSSMQQPHA